MRVDHLNLRNFKRFSEAEFKFRPGFNLLIGENGSGKTTILDALAVAIGSWFLGIRGYDTKHIESDEVRAMLTTFGDTTKIERQFPALVACDGSVLGQHLSWARSLDGAAGRTTQRRATNIKKLAAETERRVRAGEAITLPVISYYGTKRLWVQPKDMYGGEDLRPGEFQERLQGYYNSVDQRINVAGVLRWLRFEKFVALEEGKERAAYSAVKAAIVQCVEGCIGADFNVKEGTLLVEIKGRGKLPFHMLSDGQRTMLALVADIAFKATQLNPHLSERAPAETPGTVLIDELDLHLHPRWQRHVVADLRRTFPAIQFFATTHSPQIIGETPHEEIFLLKANGTWVNPSQSVGLSANQVLRDIMGTDYLNPGVAEEFDAIFRKVESGEFGGARQMIADLRSRRGDFPDLVEAATYMDRVERVGV